MIYTPGTVGVCHDTGKLGVIIRTGEFLASRKRKFPNTGPAPWYWNHAFVIVNEDGKTIEAGSQGIVVNHVEDHGNRLILSIPKNVNAHNTTVFAISKLGAKYSYLDDVCLGVDCLTGLKLHDPRKGVYICSEFAAAALVAGGWKSPKPPVEMMPSDLVWALP